MDPPDEPFTIITSHLFSKKMERDRIQERYTSYVIRSKIGERVSKCFLIVQGAA